MNRNPVLNLGIRENRHEQSVNFCKNQVQIIQRDTRRKLMARNTPHMSYISSVHCFLFLMGGFESTVFPIVLQELPKGMRGTKK